MNSSTNRGIAASLTGRDTAAQTPESISASTSAVGQENEKPVVTIAQVALLIWQEVRVSPGGWQLCIASLLSAVLAGPFVLSLYTGYAFGVMETQHWDGTESLSVIARVSALVLVLLLLGSLSDYAVNRCAASINARLWQRNIGKLFGIALSARPTTANQAALHSVKSFLADSVEVFQRHQLYVLQNALRAVLVVAITLAYLFAHNPWFILVVFVALAMTFFSPIWLAKKAQPAIDEEPHALNQFNHYLLSILRLGDLLAYQDNRHLFRRIQTALQEYFVVEGRKWITWNFAFNLKVTLNILTSIGLLGIGGTLYFYGLIGVAELIAIYILVSMTVPRLDSLYKIYNYLQSLKAYYQQAHYLEHLESLQQVGNRHPTGPVTNTTLGNPLKNIVLHCQRLLLPGHDHPLFEEVRIELSRGQLYLLSGKSGSGKTSLVNLLLGFQVPDQGALLINGSPLAPEQLSTYWQRIALQEQHNLLISSLTAQENLQLVKRPIHPERFARACHCLGLDAWGHKPVHQLSGGEIQRLCFLRAYVYEADVFIFDEPTSALDGVNEDLIKDLLLALTDAIVLVISHSEGFADIAHRVWTLAGDGSVQDRQGGRQP